MHTSGCPITDTATTHLTLLLTLSQAMNHQTAILVINRHDAGAREDVSPENGPLNDRNIGVSFETVAAGRC
jgi:hypothetical protein